MYTQIYIFNITGKKKAVKTAVQLRNSISAIQWFFYLIAFYLLFESQLGPLEGAQTSPTHFLPVSCAHARAS